MSCCCGCSAAASGASSAGLSDHVLKDIGVTRADVDGETGKAFWRR